MTASSRALAVLLLSAVLAACGGGGSSSSAPPPPGVPLVPVSCNAGAAALEGIFRAPNGTTPVGGATVTISTAGGCAATTNADGRFKFLGLPATTATVTATKGNFTVSAAATPGATVLSLVIPANSAKLAYVAGSFDSIETVLRDLGFAPVAVLEAELATTTLSQYDALFLDCGLDESVIEPAVDEAVAHATTTALAAFVAAGGTLYASDWAAAYVEATFPGKVVFAGKIGSATEAPVTAQVLDPSLQAALGATTAQIMFDLGGWVVIDSAGPGTQTLIAGPADSLTGAGTVTKPYVVRFSSGSGRVTYTSFHNEAQATADMQRLLEAMVFGL